MKEWAILAATFLAASALAQTPPAREFAFGPSTEKAVDPNQVITSVEADIKEVIAQNDKKAFGLSPAQSDKARGMLSSMLRAVNGLHAKYRRVKEPVDGTALYREIEDTLDKSGGDDKLLMLALKGKGTGAQSRRCDSFCWKQCGPNHVGDWGCFLTCQRHC
jgi:hypothetical protein